MTAPNWNNVTAVVLAGGLGERIRHLAPGVPKPMITVRGRPFLEWVVRFLQRQGVRQVVLSAGFKAEVIERHFAKEPVPGMRVTCVAEPSALGTGGGLLYAARQSKAAPEAWLVLNGDSLVLASLAEVAGPLEDPAVWGVLTGVVVPETAGYGTMRFDSMNRLSSFEGNTTGPGVINAGLYLLKPRLLAEFPAARPLSLERDVFPHWLARRLDLRVQVVEAPFLDIGTPESLPLAEPFIARYLSQIEAL